MQGKPDDITGRTFGRLTVLGRGTMTRERYPRRMWHCRCTCGTEVMVAGTNLRDGRQVSCGCYRADQARAMGRRNGSRPHARAAANALASAMRGWGAA